MPTNTRYDTWFQRIRNLRPGQRITQIRTFAWLLVGIFQSRSVCLSRIASKIPGPAKLVSVTRRLSRLLDNAHIRVRDWYEPVAQQWLEAQFRHLSEIRPKDGNPELFLEQTHRSRKIRYKCYNSGQIWWVMKCS